MAYPRRHRRPGQPCGRAAILVGLATACWQESSSEDHVGSAARAATGASVTWMNSVNVDLTPDSNDLTKPVNSSSGWNAGAVSVQTIEHHGYIEFTTAENTTDKAAGLSLGDNGQTLGDIDFAIYLHSDGTVRVREGGTPMGSFGSYVAGDVFRVEVKNGQVTYSKNGTPPFYRSLLTPAFPLLLDTALYSPGATIRDATMTTPAPVTWTPPLVNASATPSSNDLTKPVGSSTAWDAGAASVETIERRGYVEFTTAENTTDKAAGLSHGDSGQTLNDIDYAIYLHSDGTVRIREGGVHMGSFGPYAAGDVFRVEVAGGVVTYSKNGASPFYTSTAPPTFPLLLDTSLYSPGATIRDAAMMNPAAVTWTPLVWASATPTSNDLTKTGTSNEGDAGAASVEAIERRGYVEFTTAENNKSKAAGLSHGDDGLTLNDIDYAIYLRATGAFEVREGGVNKGSFGTYVAGDVFRVSVANGRVTYSKNGVPFYPLNGEAQTAPTFPLLLDTALYTPGATIRDVTMTTTALHVSTQESQLEAGLLTCGRSDVVLLNGKYLLQVDDPVAPEHDPPITLQAFLSNDPVTGTPQTRIEAEIDAYLAPGGAGESMNGFDGYLVLDIERPGPRGLGNSNVHSDSEKNQIVDAYIRRINAARKKFPKAKIGLYETLNPDEQGDATNSVYTDRLAALIEAGKSGSRWNNTAVEAGGLYDNLSFLVPVLFVRYGCDLSDSSPCDPEWPTLAAYTRLGTAGSQKLDSSLPLLPFFTVYVPDTLTTSLFPDWMLMDLHPTDEIASLEATLGAQLDIIREYNVVDAALWIGNANLYGNLPLPDKLRVGNNDIHSWTIDNYACGI
jgi:hypothetical protein